MMILSYGFLRSYFGSRSSTHVLGPCRSSKMNDLQQMEMLTQEYQTFARATHQLDKYNYEIADVMTYVLIKTLLQTAAHLVAAYSNSTVIFSYQSDGTSNLCKHIESSGLHDSLIRTGRVLVEFLIERGLVLAVKADGGLESCIIFAVPRLLQKGKAQWQLFSSGADFCSYTTVVRSSRHRHISCVLRPSHA